METPSLNLKQTPNLLATFGDADQTAARMEEQAAVAREVARSAKAVVDARKVEAEAEARVQKLHQAHRGMNEHIKTRRDYVEQVRDEYYNGLIDSASQGAKVDGGKLSKVAQAEAECGLGLKALSLLVEHRLPIAELDALTAGAVADRAEAGELERIAQERAQRMLKKLRAVVDDEAVTQVDTRQGVIGLLNRIALDLNQQASQKEQQVAARFKEYSERGNRHHPEFEKEHVASIRAANAKL